MKLSEGGGELKRDRPCAGSVTDIDKCTTSKLKEAKARSESAFGLSLNAPGVQPLQRRINISQHYNVIKLQGLTAVSISPTI